MALVPFPVLPDIETLLMYALVPQFPSYRFVTILPAGDPTEITARIHRISGAGRHVGMDDPIVDVDVFGPKAQTGNVSSAARSIQAFLLSLMGAVYTNGVVQHASTVAGPRQLPEANPAFVRFSATYELHVHP